MSRGRAKARKLPRYRRRRCFGIIQVLFALLRAPMRPIAAAA
jgi:hypothetical protein